MIEFVKPRGDYDCVSPIINAGGNAGVAALALTAVALITHCALRAMGYANIGTKVITAIPLVLASGAALSCLAAFVLLVWMGHEVHLGLGR